MNKKVLMPITLSWLGIYCLQAQNVGIGTATPVDKLTVQTATGNFGITHTDGVIRLSTFVGGSTPNGAWLGTISNHPLSFYTNNSISQLTIATNGNIGIGNPTPVFKLTVQTNSGGYGLVQTNNTVSVGTYIGSSAVAPIGGWYGTVTNHPLYFFTNNGDAQITLLQNGYVGINTTAPNGPLDVRRISGNIGTAFFSGSTYSSVFNYSANEDTYLRGGKAGSNVIINDATPLGKVGIGTDIPTDKLTVRTTSDNYGMTHTDGAITVGSYVGGGGGWLGTKTNHPLYFFTNNGLAQMTILPDGRISINGSTANFTNSQLTVRGSLTLSSSNGTEWNFLPSGPPADTKLFIDLNGILIAEVQNDGDWVSLSDKTLKENILQYKPVLRDIKKLEVSTYHFKSSTSDSRSFGLIAQNAAEYFPEIVSETTDRDGKKLLGIAYGKTGVLAIKAIQEQQVIIEEQQQRIGAFEKRMKALEEIVQTKPN